VSEFKGPSVSIVDYQMGNVCSVQRACEAVGLAAEITADPARIESADGVILPGVGAFGDAMESLHHLGLVEILHRVVRRQKPLMGICLGMQLLMTESDEFGLHAGLNFLDGRVIRFENPQDDEGRILKVPQVGWNRIRPTTQSGDWKGSILEGLACDTDMYFVHSFYVVPRDPSVILAMSRYGQIDFASVIQAGALFACQFHPEKSGPAGISIYRNFRAKLESVRRECLV
jgi:imidazole glycerol-phosphate synthase subunit HisH